MTDHLEPTSDPVKRDRFTYDAKLVRIVDGDTVVLDIDLGCKTWLTNEHCRFYGINTPEVRGEERPEGLVASAYLDGLIGTAGELLVRTHKDKKGKYGRWLVTLMADGVNVNRNLVENGYARQI